MSQRAQRKEGENGDKSAVAQYDMESEEASNAVELNQVLPATSAFRTPSSYPS